MAATDLPWRIPQDPARPAWPPHRGAAGPMRSGYAIAIVGAPKDFFPSPHGPGVACRGLRGGV